jgi:hypothetical protein
MCEDQSKFAPLTYASYVNRKRCAESLKETSDRVFINAMKGKETIMKHTLPNGMELEGTLAQINQTRKAFGYMPLFEADGVHYNSSSRGVVEISKMDTHHIKNAIRKTHAANVGKLNTSLSDAEFLAALQKPDITVVGLVAELQRRVRHGR